MKKIIWITLILAFVLCFTACGKAENGENSESNTNAIENTENMTPKNTYTIDGITVSASGFTVEPFEDEDGYTKRICVNFTFKNDTDKAFGYINSCEGSLPDGFALKGWSDLMDMELKQIPSHSSKNVTAYLLADDSLDLSKIDVTYSFMDYNQEYWDDFGKIMTGEMTQEEYMSTYGNSKELTFELIENSVIL